MSTKKQSRTNSILTLFVGRAVILSLQTNPAQAAASASSGSRNIQPAGLTFTVNSTADEPDADPSNGVCAGVDGKCSLRAAIMESNFTPAADTIIVPAGVYTLTRPGDDDGALIGDLDITSPLTIQGAGSGATIVDGNGAVTGDRVFQILSTATAVTLSGLTVRNGKRTITFDEGGGIYWTGGGSHLTLQDVVVENNAADYEGGLSLNYSASGDVVELDHLVVRSNTARAAGGGLGVSFGNSASFNMHDSQVSSNAAYEGGGVYFDNGLASSLLSVSIKNSLIFANTASLSAGFENLSGFAAVPIVLQNDQFYQNNASFYGGAIGNYRTLSLTDTSLDSNTAVMRGGGIYDYEGGKLDIQRSTLSRNTSQTGGGVYTEFLSANSAGLVLTNSTLSGNSVSQDGAGIYANGGQIKLYNTTVAGNQILVPQGTVYAGLGGGVYLASRVGFSAQNALIATNTHRYGASSPVSDDCLGTISSLGYNLIQATTNCTITGTLTGNITGQAPVLGSLQNNGGSTQTQQLLAGSPAIDAGERPACTDAGGAPLATDQRGIVRPLGAHCDIGAVEVAPATTTVITSDTPDPSMSGANVTVNVSVFSTSGTPTGIVAVSAPDGSCAVMLNLGAGSCLLQPTTIGTQTITAVYLGDASHEMSVDTETHIVTGQITFASVGAQDGWVLETGEKSNTGGTLNAKAATLRLGDDATKKQYRSILSFATGPGLPDNAVITTITLRVRKQSSTGGGNPLATFKGFMLDVKNGPFGRAALQPGDFRTAANTTLGPFTPALVGGWYSIDLTGANAFINELATGSGLTQIRLRFKLDDNNNTIANYLSLFSGNAPKAANRPQLIITYYVP